jgi:hypothetical protein
MTRRGCRPRPVNLACELRPVRLSTRLIKDDALVCLGGRRAIFAARCPRRPIEVNHHMRRQAVSRADSTAGN